jgi:hypothetical protein
MSDIREINGKYYDFGTKNKSFLQTALELKHLGIKNYYFMLRIDNPRVADIDPFKPNITPQEVSVLMQELRSNLWYYSRAVARIRSDAGIVHFTLHRGLAAALWCFDKRFDCCLNEPRQTWKTSGTIATICGWAFQLSQNLKMHFFGKESENTKRNLATLKDDIDLLPEWLTFKKFLDADNKIKKTQQSTEILKNKLFNNELIIHPKPTSRAHAQGMGRGASAAMLYFDEIEHTPFFDELLSNSAPAFKTAADNAKAAGLPYGRIFTTTPGNLDTREGMTTLPIIQSMIPWTERIYDMSDEEIADYKSAYHESYHADETKQKTREVVDIFYLEYQYYQVRKTYEWVMEQYKLSGDKMAIRREILLQRLRGSTDSPISPEDIEYLISNMKKSDRDLLINGKWRYRLYDHGATKTIGGEQLPFDPRIPYIIAMDPAGGGGGDNTSVTIINPYNLLVAAEFKNPYISTTDAVRMLITLVNDHIPKGVIFPEKNSMGIAIIQMLVETSIKENLYWSDTDRQLEKMAEESPEEFQMRVAADQWKKYGVFTSGKTKKMMFEILFRHVAECKHILNTEYLVDDMCKLVRKRTAAGGTTIAAVQGEHDDCVMSYNIGMYLFYTGDNLDFFGINNKEHPIIGAIEIDLEGNLNEKDHMAGFFSTEGVTFESIVMQDLARVEEETKYLVDTFSFVKDEVYSKRKIHNDPLDDTVDISPYFFQTLND